MASPRNSTALICAPASFKQKYTCPLACRRRFETSPRTQPGRSPRSRSVLMRRVNAVTDSTRSSPSVFNNSSRKFIQSLLFLLSTAKPSDTRSCSRRPMEMSDAIRLEAMGGRHGLPRRRARAKAGGRPSACSIGVGTAWKWRDDLRVVRCSRRPSGVLLAS
jgi:hypothetical protein